MASSANRRGTRIALRSLKPEGTMLRLNAAQRSMLVDKLPDAANLAAGALFFGQFLGDRQFSLTLAFSGLGAWVALMAWAIVLASKGTPS
jgi:hypothetical protein